MRVGGRDAALVRSCGNLRLPRGRPPETLGNMGFAVAGTVAPPPLEALVDALGEALERAGIEQSAADDSPDLVLNVIAAERPRPFRRRSRGTFVAALHELDEPPPDPLREGYPLLVRALANVSLTYVPHQGVWFTTLERGSYLVADDDGIDALAEGVAERLLPLARSRLVIDNEFRRDLEPGLWRGDAVTESIAAAGRALDKLGLLPSPFPVEELVGERDLRHIKRLYGLGGLSYGNLSAPSPIPPMPSSGCATTASPRRGRTSRRSSDGSRRGSSAKCR